MQGGFGESKEVIYDLTELKSISKSPIDTLVSLQKEQISQLQLSIIHLNSVLSCYTTHIHAIAKILNF